MTRSRNPFIILITKFEGENLDISGGHFLARFGNIKKDYSVTSRRQSNTVARDVCWPQVH